MNKYRVFFLSTLFVTFYVLGVAQTVKYNVGDSTKMTVTGTSTLHDWTSEVKTVNGFVEVGNNMINKGKVKKGEIIKTVHVVVPVKSIISPRGATMDKKTYDALKSEEFPEIIFDLNNNEVSESTGEAFTVQSKGTLTIAGKSKEVTFPVNGLVLSEEMMSFSGAYKLNMKDYDMEPPSAMFGQIVTGEEVEIKFELIVSK